MKKSIFTFIFAVVFFTFSNAQQRDISISQLPREVKIVLNDYLDILTKSDNLDECAKQFMKIAGGGMVNPAGTSLRSSVKPYSLKKDYENVKFYKTPADIARVAKTQTSGSGYGESAIAGDWYKVYINKKNGVNGMPAPIHIVVPKNHKIIKTPKIIQIGSL